MGQNFVQFCVINRIIITHAKKEIIETIKMRRQKVKWVAINNPSPFPSHSTAHKEICSIWKFYSTTVSLMMVACCSCPTSSHNIFPDQASAFNSLRPTNNWKGFFIVPGDPFLHRLGFYLFKFSFRMIFMSFS